MVGLNYTRIHIGVGAGVRGWLPPPPIFNSLQFVTLLTLYMRIL